MRMHSEVPVCPLKTSCDSCGRQKQRHKEERPVSHTTNLRPHTDSSGAECALRKWPQSRASNAGDGRALMRERQSDGTASSASHIANNASAKTLKTKAGQRTKAYICNLEHAGCPVAAAHSDARLAKKAIDRCHAVLVSEPVGIRSARCQNAQNIKQSMLRQ